jgi:hypothetical protein
MQLRKLAGASTWRFGNGVRFQILLDNSEALFQVWNDAITQKSKHVDVHFHYVKARKDMFARCSIAEQTS